MALRDVFGYVPAARNWFADGNDNKTSPNSLYSVLRGIRRMWNASGREPLSAGEFVEFFKESYHEIQGKYRGNAASSNLTRKVQNLELKSQGIDYFILRCYAHHVHIPAPLLLLYSHIVGDVSHNNSRDSILELFDRYLYSIQSLRDELAGSSDMHKYLMQPAEAEKYEVRMDGLRILSKAFNKSTVDDSSL